MSERKLPLVPTPPSELVRSRGITGFRTRKGSVYTYNNHAKTQRFKATTSELNDRQDLTVFCDLSDAQVHQDFLVTLHKQWEDEDDNKAKVYIVERMPNDSGIKRDSIEDVIDPDSLYIAIINNNVIEKSSKATLIPTVGYNAVDTRRFVSNGEPMREIHIGNVVVDIFKQ